MLSLAHNASKYDSAINPSLVTKTIGFHGLEPELKNTLIQLLGQLTMPVLWREVTDKDADVVFLNDTAFNWLTGRSKAQGIDEKRCIVLSDNTQAAIHPYVIKKPLKARTLINCLNELCIKPPIQLPTQN